MKNARYVIRRGTLIRNANHPVGTVINQATGIEIAQKRKIGGEVKAREEKESHQIQERETSLKRGRTLPTRETKRTIKEIKTIVYVMTVHMIQNQKMTELATLDQDPTPSQKQKTRLLRRERNRKERITDQDIIKIIE